MRGYRITVRNIESVSRMVYSVMLDTIAELESRNLAATAGFRHTKQLLAGMLNLSPTEAGTRAGHLAPRRTLGGEALRTGLGVATLDYGTHLSASQARR
jgi:hypothetical protein